MIFGEGNERKQLERAMRDAGRLPPGQSLTLKWPVLHEGSVPRFDPTTWDFRVTGLLEKPLRLSWDEFSHLPMTAVTADMHCVTRWSRFDVRWEGVAFSDVMKLVSVKPEAKYVMVLAEQGYTSNVPLADLLRSTTLFALKHNGEPLPCRAWLSGATGGAASLRVEEREVGAWDGVYGAGCAGILGAEWIQHVWGSVQGGAVQWLKEQRLTSQAPENRGSKSGSSDWLAGFANPKSPQSDNA